MTVFDEIRPYADVEVPTVLGRLLAEPRIARAAAEFAHPLLTRLCPPLAAGMSARRLRQTLSDVDSVGGVQEFLADLFARMIDTTTDGFSISGLENLRRDVAYLFVSNHRDIALDSGFMNFALIRNGFATSRIAVGDNLFGADYAADLMRLNKSFIVKRGTKGAKAAYAAMSLTSAYIRHSLEDGESIWIAQREGRAKDGFDRTDPALIKMFSLAYRDVTTDMTDLVQHLRVVPVAVSYEVDPCDELKAREVYLTEQQGEYAKPDDEDLKSIAAGIVGYKGRVHVAFGRPLGGDYDDAESVAAGIDAQLVANLRVFPTHREAARLLADGLQDEQPTDQPALEAFREHLAATPESQRRFLLLQYANVLRNQRELAARIEAAA